MLTAPILTSDPLAGYHALKQEIDEAIRSVLESPHYILGPKVQDFEEAFARYTGVAHGVGMNNGTDAIHLALRALGISAGDEVITVSHTAVATVAAIEMAGAEPVLADVDPETRTMDPSAVSALIGPRTRAIVAVHLYGQPADVISLRRSCDEHCLKLVEDCAQAHGAILDGAQVGTFGDAATFSFYPTKNLGAIGDAGMVLTPHKDIADKLKLLRQYGWDHPQHSILPGWNSRMDPLQAAILSVKLRHLDAHTARRRQLAARYRTGLSDLPLKLPSEPKGSIAVYHLYVVEARTMSERDLLRAHLARNGVMAGIHYPQAVHEQPAYSTRTRTGPMHVTERLARTVLSLPLYPELENAAQDHVIGVVRDYFNSAEGQ